MGGVSSPGQETVPSLQTATSVGTRALAKRKTEAVAGSHHSGEKAFSTEKAQLGVLNSKPD